MPREASALTALLSDPSARLSWMFFRTRRRQVRLGDPQSLWPVCLPREPGARKTERPRPNLAPPNSHVFLRHHGLFYDRAFCLALFRFSSFTQPSTRRRTRRIGGPRTTSPCCRGESLARAPFWETPPGAVPSPDAFLSSLQSPGMDRRRVQPHVAQADAAAGERAARGVRAFRAQ